MKAIEEGWSRNGCQVEISVSLSISFEAYSFQSVEQGKKLAKTVAGNGISGSCKLNPKNVSTEPLNFKQIFIN